MQILYKIQINSSLFFYAIALSLGYDQPAGNAFIVIAGREPNHH